MKIGVPKEIKNNEYRVGMIPAAVRELTSRGHTVLVESKAGDAIDLSAFFSDFGALTAASSQHGNDVSIALDSNDSLMLLNVQLSALGAGDFWFV